MGAAGSRVAPRFAKGVWYAPDGTAERSVYDDLRAGAHPKRPPDRRLPLADAPRPGFDGYYEDELVMAFVPDKPCAAEHLLIVPRDIALKTVNSLTADHLLLLEHMRAVAEAQLRARAARADSPAAARAPLEYSFHVPPFNSIDHLHLHAFAPPFDSFFKRVKYFPGTPWCASYDAVCERLRADRDGEREKLR
jgi:diadenosine tetraphosphate (Ap4A) HIT family hydrolase